MLVSLKNKEKYSRYFGSLKYALYVITHPLDGFCLLYTSPSPRDA